MSKKFDYHLFLKWIALLFLLAFVTILIFSVFLYNDIEKSKNEGMLNTEKKIYDETELVTIEAIERFYGEESYHVVYGMGKDNQEKIVFIPLNPDDKKLIQIDQTEIMSKDSIHKRWKEDCTECKMVKIIPGIVGENLIWELTYRDKFNRYVLELLSIYDGKQYEKLSLTERFK